MNSDIEQLKKKIIYRSNYRGTKEMDKLLSAFTNEYINHLDINDLLDLEKLLSIDDNSLYNYFNGTLQDIDFDNGRIKKLFKNFRYKNDK